MMIFLLDCIINLVTRFFPLNLVDIMSGFLQLQRVQFGGLRNPSDKRSSVVRWMSSENRWGLAATCLPSQNLMVFFATFFALRTTVLSCSAEMIVVVVQFPTVINPNYTAWRMPTMTSYISSTCATNNAIGAS